MQRAAASSISTKDITEVGITHFIDHNKNHHGSNNAVKKYVGVREADDHSSNDKAGNRH